jgi:hypothetical protein
MARFMVRGFGQLCFGVMGALVFMVMERLEWMVSTSGTHHRWYY